MFFNNWLFLATIGKQTIVEVTKKIKRIIFNLFNENNILFIKTYKCNSLMI